jgi:hypothetical protein
MAIWHRPVQDHLAQQRATREEAKVAELERQRQEAEAAGAARRDARREFEAQRQIAQTARRDEEAQFARFKGQVEDRLHMAREALHGAVVAQDVDLALAAAELVGQLEFVVEAAKDLRPAAARPPVLLY